MEHRWAERRTSGIDVRLRSPVGHDGTGQMVNISKGGAFILTGLGLPVAMSLDIGIGTQDVVAYVVHTSPEGVGVEWCELAPQQVVKLLQAPPTQNHSVELPTGEPMGLTAG